MPFERELASVFSSFHSFENFNKFYELLSIDLINQAFEQVGVATIRKRRLPLEAVLWSVVGMSLFRQKSILDIVNQMDIGLPDNKPLVAPSAMVHARQRLGVNDTDDVLCTSHATGRSSLSKVGQSKA